MENSNEKKSKQYRVGEHIFYSENEARLAGLEQKKIDYLKSKMDYSRPESILKVYDKAISEQLFKTPVGLEFLSELHIFLTGCSDISDKDIQALPLQKGSKVVRGDNVSAGRRANTPGKKSGDSGSRALFISVMLNIVLVIAVLAMFFITLNSEQPNILNYENVITNRYASWEQQLTERENAVREKERELNIETE
ncbi:MAG: hypothetical protein LUG83_10695 [Lachnospiraceae bacterium]|nr:hypothetical protein [Lachnospiraceae bacterium]